MAIPLEQPDKWSRNLSEETQNESNRSRLIEKQRHLLESKRSRQQQVTVTSTRPKSARSLRPTSGLSRSNEKLIDSGKDANSLYDRDGIVNPVSVQSSDDYDDFKSTNHKDQRRSKSPPPDSSPTHHYNQSDLVRKKKQQIPPRTPHRSGEARSVSSSYEDLKDELETIRDLDISEKIHELNPLKTILSSNELLLFSTQPVSPCKTYQCTIIRDKRGIDRSFYPTYYIHLQAIVDKQNGEQSDHGDGNVSTSSPSISERDHSPDRSSKPPNSGSSHSVKSSANHRQVFLLGGRRRKKSKTYLISNDPFDITRDNCIAKLKSNVLGTQFSAIRTSSDGHRYEIATIVYETNVLGFKGPRKMTVIVPKNDEVCPYPSSTLLDIWKSEASSKSLISLKNKTPVWNEDTQSYVLNFHGRVTQASVKNFQLVVAKKQDDSNEMGEIFHHGGKSDKTSTPSRPSTPPTFFPTNPAPNSGAFGQLDDDIGMQFGRISDKEFTCDVTWPLSILQAFSIALSSFDSKLACE